MVNLLPSLFQTSIKFGPPREVKCDGSFIVNCWRDIRYTTDRFMSGDNLVGAQFYWAIAAGQQSTAHRAENLRSYKTDRPGATSNSDIANAIDGAPGNEQSLLTKFPELPAGTSSFKSKGNSGNTLIAVLLLQGDRHEIAKIIAAAGAALNHGGQHDGSGLFRHHLTVVWWMMGGRRSPLPFPQTPRVPGHRAQRINTRPAAMTRLFCLDVSVKHTAYWWVYWLV